MNSSDILTKERIITALEALNNRLTDKGVTGELCIYGGATMILAFDARESTRDVDAVFVPKTEIYVEDYYPASRIPVKTQFFIEEIIGEMEGGSK